MRLPQRPPSRQIRPNRRNENLVESRNHGGLLCQPPRRCTRSAQHRLEEEVTDFHAIPEIAAAVQSFVMSREAVPGIYVYFDIGGGTVDGVAFNYLNYGGERRINFYSGKVEPLGVSAIGSAINANNGDELDATILESLLRRCSADIYDDYAYRVRRLVAGVVMTAKMKDGGTGKSTLFKTQITSEKSSADFLRTACAH